MRKREAEAIVDDIINEIRYYRESFKETLEHLDNTHELHLFRNKLVKIVMDEE